MRLPIVGCLAALLLASLPGDGAAQRILGASLQQFHGEGRFAAVAVRRTDVGRHRVGPTLGAAVVPEALRIGVILVGLDAGVERHFPVGTGALLLQGGVSSLVAIGRYGLFHPGVQAGAGMLLPLERRARIRLDLTRHFYLSAHERRSMWSLSVGVAVLQERQRHRASRPYEAPTSPHAIRSPASPEG